MEPSLWGPGMDNDLMGMGVTLWFNVTPERHREHVPFFLKSSSGLHCEIREAAGL